MKCWLKQKPKVIYDLLHKAKKRFSKNAGLKLIYTLFPSAAGKMTCFCCNTGFGQGRNVKKNWQEQRQKETDLISHELIFTNCRNSKENMNSISTEYDMELFGLSLRGKNIQNIFRAELNKFIES